MTKEEKIERINDTIPLIHPEDNITYGKLSQALEQALKIYRTYDGVRFLLEKRAEAIEKIVAVSGGRVKGIFSSGYPNYIVPEIDMSTSDTTLTRENFIPVPEILQYVQHTLEKANNHESKEVWPCATCYSSLGLQSLRPDGHKCVSSVTPFYMYSTIPDIDLYIIIDDPADAGEIMKAYVNAGLNVAENQMIESVTKFPEIINIDPHFVTTEEFCRGLYSIASEPDRWFEVKIPTIHHHGNLVAGTIHLGLDFPSQFVAHVI